MQTHRANARKTAIEAELLERAKQRQDSQAELQRLAELVREGMQKVRAERKVGHPQFSIEQVAGLIESDVETAKRVIYHLERTQHARKNKFGNWDID